MSPTLIHKYRLQKTLPILLLLVLTVQAMSQSLPDYRRLATQYFNSQQYYAAAEYYKKALGLDESTRSIQFPYYTSGKQNFKPGKKTADDQTYLYYQLAESYRLYNDFQHAQPLYEKFADSLADAYPYARLWLGVCYRANGNPEGAKVQVEKFLSGYHRADEYLQKAQIELASCNFTIDQKKYPVNIKLNRLGEPINSTGSNYRLQWVSNNDIQFTSSRAVKSSSGEMEYPSRILQGSFSGSNLAPLFSDKNIETAAAIVSADGLSLYVTGWKRNAGKNKTYAIYQSVRTRVGAAWPEPTMMPEPVNSAPFNSKEPYITDDGKFLVFASDRPGGLGQYDLYYISISGHEIAGRVMNMGKNINTPMRDESPFYDSKTREFFFSSNGRVGLGGLDIYRTVGEFAQNSWEEPLNMGISVNSIKDDLYFMRAHNKTYLSSDRQSLCCLELFEVKPLHATFTVNLVDCDTRAPIKSAGASISIYDSTEQVLQANKDMTGIGSYSFLLGSVGALKVIGVAEGYDTAKAIWRVKIQENEDDSTSVLRLCLSKKMDYLEKEYKQIITTIPQLKVGYDAKEINIEYPSARLFVKDNYKLTAAGKKTLDSLATILKEYPQMELVMNGYIDYPDGSGFNDYVSWEMAYSVYDYIMSKGVDGKNIIAPKVEKFRPGANKTIQKRRVNIVIRKKPGNE